MTRKIIYHLYPLSWTSLKAMQEFLPRIKKLEADYVWLSPIFRSPLIDGGYDVSDYKDINHKLGDLHDLQSFIDACHQLDMKVLLDLPMNHTSVEHAWFCWEHPEYYGWSETDKAGWKNVFDSQSAWAFDERRKKYYCHLFHERQADLAWFKDDNINQSLVNEFRKIVNYWVNGYKVDGFRLDAVQCLNKDMDCTGFSVAAAMVNNEKAKTVVNAVFEGYDRLYLLAEVLDPANGKVVEDFVNNSRIDACIDTLYKDSFIKKGSFDFAKTGGNIEKTSQVPGFVFDLESHDSPRFPSAARCTPEKAIEVLFSTGANTICIYQGQELGLVNPTRAELPDARLLQLDAQAAMRARNGEHIDELRDSSRANTRVPMSMREYARQESTDGFSCLKLTKSLIKKWKYVS